MSCLTGRPAAAGCGARDCKAMTNDEAKILEAKVTEMSEENRRLTDMIARLYGSQIERLGLDGAASRAAAGVAVAGGQDCRKRSKESMEMGKSCDASSSRHQRQRQGRRRPRRELRADDGTCRRIKVSRVCRRIDPSDTSLVVKDGYQWRKYGKKVTRDNPSPRGYFWFTFAPSCPVKKKVQWSVEDSSLPVAGRPRGLERDERFP